MNNTSLFLAINGLAGHWGWLDALGVFCAEYLVYGMVIGVFILAIRHYHRTWPHWRDMLIVSLVSAIIARFGVASLIRYFYYHPRPYWVLSQTHLLLAKELESSFPSGHTIFAFALATGVYLYNKKYGRWYLALAAVVGISRVYAGVHWPYDVIAGAVLGIATALVCSWIYHKLKHIVGL